MKKIYFSLIIFLGLLFQTQIFSQVCGAPGTSSSSQRFVANWETTFTASCNGTLNSITFYSYCKGCNNTSGHNVTLRTGATCPGTSTVSSLNFTLPNETGSGTYTVVWSNPKPQLSSGTQYWFDFDFSGNFAGTVGSAQGHAGNSECSTPGGLNLDLDVTLPVELTKFEGRKRESNIQLNWQTASETNNQGFQIEHSLDNRTWSSIGFVAGQGTTYKEQDYTFMHKNPRQGINYYRLKQLDYDGAFEYSDVVSVQLADHSRQLAVYPNPVQSDQLNINLPEFETESVQLQLFDYAGRLVQQQVLYVQEAVLQVGDLLPGIYLLHIQIEGQRFFERVVIQ